MIVSNSANFTILTGKCTAKGPENMKFIEDIFRYNADGGMLTKFSQNYNSYSNTIE